MDNDYEIIYSEDTDWELVDSNIYNYLKIIIKYTLINVNNHYKDFIIYLYINKAYNIAYMALIFECIQLLYPLILKCKLYNIDYNSTIVIKTMFNDLIININNNKYYYSKYLFLNNLLFQEDLRNKINLILNCSLLFMSYNTEVYITLIYTKQLFTKYINYKKK